MPAQTRKSASARASGKPRRSAKREGGRARRASQPVTRTLDARPDTLDFRDKMFEPTLVEVPGPAPAAATTARRKVPILDQGQEGACTGFGLATVVHYLLRTRQVVPDTAEVSPRMLYDMARRYDEWPGEHYEGSSARGAMKGWHKHGVCSSRHWKYTGKQDPARYAERFKDALQPAARRLLPREPQGHHRDARGDRRGRHPLRDRAGPRRLEQRRQRTGQIEWTDEHEDPRRSRVRDRRLRRARLLDPELLGTRLGTARLLPDHLRRLARQRHRRVGGAARRADRAARARVGLPRNRRCRRRARAATCSATCARTSSASATTGSCAPMAPTARPPRTSTRSSSTSARQPSGRAAAPAVRARRADARGLRHPEGRRPARRAARRGRLSALAHLEDGLLDDADEHPQGRGRETPPRRLPRRDEGLHARSPRRCARAAGARDRRQGAVERDEGERDARARRGLRGRARASRSRSSRRSIPALEIHLVGHSAGSILLGGLVSAATAERAARTACRSTTCTLWAPACTIDLYRQQYLPAITQRAARAVRASSRSPTRPSATTTARTSTTSRCSTSCRTRSRRAGASRSSVRPTASRCSAWRSSCARLPAGERPADWVLSPNQSRSASQSARARRRARRVRRRSGDAAGDARAHPRQAEHRRRSSCAIAPARPTGRRRAVLAQ